MSESDDDIGGRPESVGTPPDWNTITSQMQSLGVGSRETPSGVYRSEIPTGSPPPVTRQPQSISQTLPQPEPRTPEPESHWSSPLRRGSSPGAAQRLPQASGPPVTPKREAPVSPGSQQMITPVMSGRLPLTAEGVSPPHLAGSHFQSGVRPERWRRRSPDIVRRYKNPITGSPEFTRMFADLEPMRPHEDSSDFGRRLSESSRRSSFDMRVWDSGRKARQEELLKDRRHSYNPGTDRWTPTEATPPATERKGKFLRPRRGSAPDLFEERFNRSVSEMQSRPHRSRLMPTGRLGYGPQTGSDGGQRQRSFSALVGQSVHRPAEWPTREREFTDRLRQLPPEDVRLYRVYRHSVDLNKQREAEQRMVGPHTRFALSDADRARVSQIRGDARRAGDRTERRFQAREGSVLPSAIGMRSERMRPIHEEETGRTRDEITRQYWDNYERERQAERTRTQEELKRKEEQKKRKPDDFCRLS